MGRFNRTRRIGSKNRPFFQDRDKKSDRRFLEKSVLRLFDLFIFSPPRRVHGLAHCRLPHRGPTLYYIWLRFHHLYLKLNKVFLFKIYNTIFIFIITILTFIMLKM